MNNALGIHATTDDSLQSSTFTIRDDLCIDSTVTFKNTEYYGLAQGSTAPFAFDPFGTEETFVYFNFTLKRRLGFTIKGNPCTYSIEVTVNGISVKSRKRFNLSGTQIKAKSFKN